MPCPTDPNILPCKKQIIGTVQQKCMGPVVSAEEGEEGGGVPGVEQPEVQRDTVHAGDLQVTLLLHSNQSNLLYRVQICSDPG